MVQKQRGIQGNIMFLCPILLRFAYSHCGCEWRVFANSLSVYRRVCTYRLRDFRNNENRHKNRSMFVFEVWGEGQAWWNGGGEGDGEGDGEGER